LTVSETRFHTLVERSPFGIYVVDSHLRILLMNETSQRGAFRNVHPILGRDLGEAMRILWPGIDGRRDYGYCSAHLGDR